MGPSSLLDDLFVNILVRLAGVGAVTWTTTEALPELFPALGARVSKRTIGLIVGPLLALLAWGMGIVEIPFALHGALGSAPPAFQSAIKVGFVLILGFLATVSARKFHDRIVGPGSSPSAPAPPAP